MIIKGRVVSGFGIGKKIGYPTANLEIYGGSASDGSEAEPRHIQSGVYAARATYEGSIYNAAAVVGARPHAGKPLLEVHLLDFNGDLYGKELSIEILEKVSEIETRDDKAVLRRKIANDIKKVRLCLRG